MAETVPLVILLLTFSLAFAAEPAVKIAVTNKGLGYASQLTAAVVKNELKTMRIPDQSASDSGVYWELKNICIKNISDPDTHISTNHGEGGVTLALSINYINLHLDWSAKYWIVIEIPARGSVDVSIWGVSVTLVAELGEKNGRPSVFAKSCNCSISEISIEFHGGVAAFVLNLFRGVIKHKIITLLQDKVCAVVTEQVNTRADQDLSRMKMNVDIADSLILDYSLIEAPKITNNSIELANKGTFYCKDKNQESPCTPTGVPALSDFSNMVYIYVTECSANTLAYSAHTCGHLKYNVPVEMLREYYPNSTAEIRLSSSRAPSVKFVEGNVNVAVAVNVEVIVYTRDGVVYPLVLKVSAEATLQTYIVNGHLAANITDYSFKTIAFKPYNREINEQDLKEQLREAINDAVILRINPFMNQGFPLPGTDIYLLNNTRLDMKTGYLQVGADVGYMN